MNVIQENVSLKRFNTFGIDVSAKYFIEIEDESQLIQLSKTEKWNEPKLVLGGGSNVLLMNDFKGLVIHIASHGIKLLEEDDHSVVVSVAAGENWHQFVMTAIENGWFGIENLSLIPGSVGASPMQNIGAYGVEIKQVFERLTAFHIHQKTFKTFEKEECEFGYRSSVFKTREKGNYIITNVVFRLSRLPKINCSYGAIQSTLDKRGIEQPSPKDVSNAVIEIRQSKLPDPSVTGNAGSFFKNPIVSKALFHDILEHHPDMPHYVVDERQVKIPAGWLIDQCGFKGIEVGNTGTYDHQALIIVNRGNATGQEIWAFAQQIQTTVKKEFSIDLEPEVNLV